MSETGKDDRPQEGVSYKDAGVDLDVYAEAMSRLPRLMHRTHSPRVLSSDGGFAGLFRLDFKNRLFARNYRDPVLVAGTDGVGTKLKLAQLTEVHNSVGIDLVAMCVNDILCCGAEPLFFLDYVAMSHDDPPVLEQLVQGISDGCLQSECALLGGETAIMPDLYQQGEYDLAGFCVGVVERRNLVEGKAIVADDVVVGLASSGLHSNGFSLVRKAVFDRAKLSVDDLVTQFDRTVGDLLLTPTAIYARAIRDVLRRYRVKTVVHGIAHITGGGLEENIGRILPGNVDVEISLSSWEVPDVFRWVQELGQVEEDEMFRVFNMGIGMALIVSPYYAESIQRTVRQRGFDSWIIGRVKPGTGQVELE